MKNIRRLAIVAAIISSVSGMAYADGSAASASAQVQASFSLTNPGTVSTTWNPAGDMSVNSASGTDIGSLDISFSGGNTVVIKDAAGPEMQGLFTWRNDSDTGVKLYAKAYYQGNALDMNTAGEATIKNLDGKSNIRVTFKKQAGLQLKAGSYSDSLLVDLYTM
ncbi:hypothetical protein H0S68_25555 (plasmid) [Serratia sp. AXJ-M]|uniref:hypothetical protein n=1 Tax=Serratia sp. AXJ-M TaxID=2754727 RepID=UPI00397D7E3D